MSDIAFEVSVNGTRVFTVGMENWSFLSARILGHRHTPEYMEEILLHMPDADLDKFSQDRLDLMCSVGVPSVDDPKQSQGRNYEAQSLNVGDTVTIRIVETDDTDEPQPSRSDARLLAVPLAMPQGEDE